MNNTFGMQIVPENDTDRLESLKRYKILGTTPEKQFDQLAMMIAKVFNVPIALIAFVDENEVFFKANIGMGNVRNVDRGVSICSLAILQSEPTIFTNPIDEPCLLQNPLVHGEFGLRFYAGVPLVSADGFNIGSVCIIDKKQRFFNNDQIDLLKDFSVHIISLLELRLKTLV